MLKYVDETFRSHPRAYISMESRMACGMGACYACVLHVAGEDQSVNKRVCEDGPVLRLVQFWCREVNMSKNRLAVLSSGFGIKNPIIPASGCFVLVRNMPNIMT